MEERPKKPWPIRPRRPIEFPWYPSEESAEDELVMMRQYVRSCAGHFDRFLYVNGTETRDVLETWFNLFDAAGNPVDAGQRFHIPPLQVDVQTRCPDVEIHSVESHALLADGTQVDLAGQVPAGSNLVVVAATCGVMDTWQGGVRCFGVLNAMDPATGATEMIAFQAGNVIPPPP